MLAAYPLLDLTTVWCSGSTGTVTGGTATGKLLEVSHL